MLTQKLQRIALNGVAHWKWQTFVNLEKQCEKNNKQCEKKFIL